MEYFIEKTAKTIEDAVKLALEDLNTDRDSVNVEIVDKGSKGILGLLGNKEATVRVTLKESISDIAASFLMDIFEKMDIDTEIDTSEDNELLQLTVTGKDCGSLIGRRGETLDALQYLTSLVVNRNRDKYKRVTLDIENYREKREQALIRLAEKLADKVIRNKHSITLEPMNPYERKVIHSTLQENRYVKTYSIGEEPGRKVVISLK
jgi:spoIIIJ-associated protein